MVLAATRSSVRTGHRHERQPLDDVDTIALALHEAERDQPLECFAYRRPGHCELFGQGPFRWHRGTGCELPGRDSLDELRPHLVADRPADDGREIGVHQLIPTASPPSEPTALAAMA